MVSNPLAYALQGPDKKRFERYQRAQTLKDLLVHGAKQG
jgi:hypothetical protein